MRLGSEAIDVDAHDRALLEIDLETRSAEQKRPEAAEQRLMAGKQNAALVFVHSHFFPHASRRGRWRQSLGAKKLSLKTEHFRGDLRRLNSAAQGAGHDQCRIHAAVALHSQCRSKL